MATIYYRYSDTGAVGTSSNSGEAKPALPEGAVEITQDEYDAALADIEAGYDDLDAEEHAEQQKDAYVDYQALLAAGIPEETAQRLSGYQPESPGDDSPGSPDDGVR